MLPQWKVDDELLLLLEEFADPEDQAIEAFVNGMMRALEWASGRGMSPIEFLVAIRRTPRMH